MPTNIQATDIDAGGVGDVTPWTGATTKDVSTAGTGGSSSAVLNVAASQLSVTVPMSLPIHLAANGTVTTSEDAKIINNSIGRVKVTNVDINSANGWSVINYDTDLSTYKVNEKKVGFTLNGIKTGDAGLTFDETKFPSLAGKNNTTSDELKLDYSAVVTPQANVLTNEEVAKVVFTVDWDSSEELVTGIHMTAEDATAFGYSYDLKSDDTYEITALHNDAAEYIEIPSMIDNKVVTSIGGYNAFGYSVHLISVTIPDSIISINAGTFSEFDGAFSVPNINYSNKMVASGSPWGAQNINLPLEEKNGLIYGYSLSENGYILLRAKKDIVTANIPATYNETPVVKIGDSAFATNFNLTSVIIPDCVTYIGDFAFSLCVNLSSIKIGNSVETIGFMSFVGTGLSSIVIPNSVRTIGYMAFANIEGISGGGVDGYIPLLTSVTIPSSVTTIADNAFLDVPQIFYSGSAAGAPWGAVEHLIPIHMTAQQATTFGYTYELQTDGTYNLTNMPTNVEKIQFPSSIDGKAVTQLGFKYSGGDGSTSGGKILSSGRASSGPNMTLKTVIIPDSVKIIGTQAFQSTLNLQSVTIPSSVTTIGDAAFAYCGRLASLTVPSSVTTIRSQSFLFVPHITYTGTATGSPWGAKSIN